MDIRLAGCVILDEANRIHLLHRNKKGVTQWELPGGKAEAHETDEQAAIREVVEELGVTVTVTKKLGVTHFTENDISYIYSWFLAVIEKGKPSICEPEAFDDLKSFSPTELANLKLSTNMKQLYEALLTSRIQLSATKKIDQ